MKNENKKEQKRIPERKRPPSDILKRTAGEVKSYRVRMKMLSVLLVLLVVFAGLTYLVAALYNQSGSFTVGIDKYEMQKYGLSLCESEDFRTPTSNLNAKISETMTNIAGETIPANVDNIDGAHSGKDYIAYTFYLKNAGETEVSYEYSVNMSNITNALDEALRLRLYVDGVPTEYAKTRSDGSGPEPGTVEFYSAYTMAKGRVDAFAPGDYTKFTVVLWVEGNDPDCVDWLIGGQLKADMVMNIVH